MFIRKLPYDSKHPYSIYKQFEYSEEPTLSEVIKDWGKGHNQLIKTGAVKVLELAIYEKTPPLWKNWPIVKDINFKIKSGTFVGTGKIPTFIIIWIKR